MPLTPVKRLQRALRTTSGAELGFTLRAAILAPWVEWSLAASGLERTLDRLERAPRGVARPSGLEGATADRAVARAFRVQPWLPGRCLSRALVRFALHCRAGDPATLIVGVRKPSEGGFRAHAWVEPPREAAPTDFEPLLTRESR